VIYRDELGQHQDGVQVSYTLTRSQPPGWAGYAGRINQALLAEVAWPAETRPLTYIDGPAGPGVHVHGPAARRVHVMAGSPHLHC
jgi:hypothetical protein